MFYIKLQETKDIAILSNISKNNVKSYTLGINTKNPGIGTIAFQESILTDEEQKYKLEDFVKENVDNIKLIAEVKSHKILKNSKGTVYTLIETKKDDNIFYSYMFLTKNSPNTLQQTLITFSDKEGKTQNKKIMDKLIDTIELIGINI